MRHRTTPAVIHGLQGCSSERFLVRAILQNFAENFESFQIHELLGDEGIGKFLLQHLGVGVADAERKQGADVAENRLPDWQRNLVNILVR